MTITEELERHPVLFFFLCAIVSDWNFGVEHYIEETLSGGREIILTGVYDMREHWRQYEKVGIPGV